MKKIINGKLYDTDKAQELGNYEFSRRNCFDWYSETLYRKRTGGFFLYCEGNAMSPYARRSDNGSGYGERIKPLTYSEAQEWAEENLDGDDYISIFGDPEEDDTRQSLNLSLSAAVVRKIKQEAARQGLTVSSYIESLVSGTSEE